MKKKNKHLNIFNTIIDLKFKQIFFQIYYRIRAKFTKPGIREYVSDNKEGVNWELNYSNEVDSYLGKHTFRFLNKTEKFENIDWNFSKNGKLWTYNLNYFDFLAQETLSKEEGLLLIKNYIKNYTSLIDGKEPYPISLRVINWIKFISHHKIKDESINQVLFNDLLTLSKTLEFHLLGNHLLENAFALLFGSYYFKNDKFYKKASSILHSELKEQILKDGAHFELSPMYHNIILFRILDSIQLLQNNKWKNNQLLDILYSKSKQMLAWLKNIQFQNGSSPMVNDSAYGIALKNSQIFQYAEFLKIDFQPLKLEDSGYRKWCAKNFELFLDIGNIGPHYIPGHAHADTFNFLLNVNSNPILTEVGTSTYEKNAIRKSERSTSSHNTVEINGRNQSEVWGGFRVGRKARIISLIETDNQIKASHDGYKHLGYIHQRSFELKNDLVITDKVEGPNPLSKAYFHFHPSVKSIEFEDQSTIKANGVILQFKGDIQDISIVDYNFANGFNKLLKGRKVIISFNNTLETKIKL